MKTNGPGHALSAGRLKEPAPALDYNKKLFSF